MTTGADKGAMSKLDVSGNYGYTRGYGKNVSFDFIRPIASMLKVNITITELNIANSSLDAKAVGILAPALEDNRALSKLDIHSNDTGDAKKTEIRYICHFKSITCLL